MIDYNKIYIKYANDVINGKICACNHIILACRRMLNWFSRNDIYFDYEYVDYLIQWVHKLKHTEAPYTGQPFDLLDWQQFCVANIYGWKWKDTNLRVTTKVFIMISRKAGKTAFASALALIAAIADKEVGAEVELVANSAQQAGIAFSACSNFASSLDPKEKYIKRNRGVIKIEPLKSKIQVLCSESMTLDGYNASCFILDEFHAAKNWNLYNVMRSSQGMRQQPLAIVITTAGYLLSSYPCFDYHKMCIDILNGVKDDDTQFSAIYQLDEDDDWKDERNWQKCQPSLGQTVTVKRMREFVQSAENLPSTEPEVKTKNFNMFVNSINTWIPDEIVEKSMKKIDIADFKNELCYGGVDLAAVSDLTATAILFPPNSSRDKYKDKYVFKVYCYLPEFQLTQSLNKELYKKWRKDKYLYITEGNVCDYDYILKDQIDIYNYVDLVSIAYDSWNATQWAINATNNGLPIQPYSQSLGNFNKPTKEFERLMLQGKVVIDLNPIIRWSLSNCELKIDHLTDNCKPIKSGGDRTKKIDPVIAILQALGAYLLDGNEIE